MNAHDNDIHTAIMDVITDVWDRAKQINEATYEVLDLIEADRQRRDEPVDKGPWKAGVNRIDKRTFIESDDFTHDVRLYVDGDFADQDEKLAYALGIADQLNASLQPAEPVKRKRPYAQGTALGEFGIIPMCDQVDDEPVKVPSDENGGHRLAEPDHETALALADAPRSLRNYVAALQSRVQELSADALDAKRYRWLRDPCSGAERVIFYCRGDYGMGLISGSMLDAAIDAAMEKQP